MENGNKTFEDEFMDIQSGLISLCLELVEGQADEIYVYCAIDETSQSFNSFFNINNEIKTNNQLNLEESIVFDFLKLGTGDLNKVRNVCQKYNMPLPAEMKMCYDVKSGKFSSDYSYDEIDPEITLYERFIGWIEEVKNQKGL